MVIQLSPVRRKGVAHEIVEQLRDEILSGRIQPGEFLPAERALAETLAVNRLTVRQAIARLEALGLVRAHHGRGTLVLDFRRTAGLGLLTDLMTARRRDAHFPLDLLRDLLEVRRLLAVEVVALAAERRTEDDLRDLRVLVAGQQARVADPVAFARGDIAFTRRLVQVCRNVAMELLFNTVAAFVDAHPDVAQAIFAAPAENAAQYVGVLFLIEGGRAGDARALVRAALDDLDGKTVARFAAAHSESARP